MLNLHRSNGCGDLLGENTREQLIFLFLFFFFSFSSLSLSPFFPFSEKASDGAGNCRRRS